MCESTEVEYSQNTVLGCVYCTLALVSKLATRDLALQVKKAAASLHSEKLFFSRLGR